MDNKGKPKSFKEFFDNFNTALSLAKYAKEEGLTNDRTKLRLDDNGQPYLETLEYRGPALKEPISPFIANLRQIEPIGRPQDMSVPGATAYDANTDTTFYTYKNGDNFSDVIKRLGLTSGRGLWGSNGDVAYYTQQLREQGIPGMVPVGRTIHLKGRK